MEARPRLSCEQCRRRKTKCDKAVPCSACKVAGLQCETVQRARLPRGRSGKVGRGRDALENRITRLESLLKRREHGPENGQSHDTASSAKRREADPQYVAQEFWEALSQEVSGIRDIIHDSEDDEEESLGAFLATKAVDTTNEFRSPLFAQQIPANQTTTYQGVPRELREFLLDIYRERVDVIFKVCHWPTTLRMIEASYDQPAEDVGHRSSLNALEYSLYFMAVCAMSEGECVSVFASKKQGLIEYYQLTVETLLARAKTLQCPNILNLQAFVTYLKGIRSCQRFASSWTLLAVAVRLANALSLGSEKIGKFSQLDLEARRRLWYSINLLDIQAMLDRGTTPIVPASALGSPPLNISDEQLCADSPLQQLGTPHIHDMSFSSMTFAAMVCQKEILHLSADGSMKSDEIWIRQLNLLSNLQESFAEKYVTVSSSPTPLEFLMKNSAQTILSAMRLFLRRPPYRQASVTVPAWDKFDAMKTSIDVLERYSSKSWDILSPWAWKAWPPWAAVAVTLAELCRNPQADGADRAYTLAVQIFQRHATPTNDEESGMLWKPIAKLIRRVSQLRGNYASVARQPSHSEPGLDASYKMGMNGIPENVDIPTGGHRLEQTPTDSDNSNELDLSILQDIDYHIFDSELTAFPGLLDFGEEWDIDMSKDHGPNIFVSSNGT